MRRRLVWAISLSLTVVSWLSAHCIAYAIAAPADHHLALIGHDRDGHLEHGRLVIGLFVVLLFTLLAGGVAAGLEGRRERPVPLEVFGLLPPIGFVMQEYIERLIHGDGLPVGMVSEPAFVLGLLLQLPFALVALGLAWLFLALGSAIGLALARGARPPSAALSVACVLPSAAELPRIPALALGHGQRAPPALVPAV
jgi:hypothetical protein